MTGTQERLLPPWEKIEVLENTLGQDISLSASRHNTGLEVSQQT
jgi:hypothetical protein